MMLMVKVPQVMSLLILFSFLSCSKYRQSANDLDGNLYFRGRVFVYNNFSNDGTNTFLPGLSVLIARTSDENGNYLYSVKSDSLGYYVFQNLNKNAQYIITATDSINGLQYKGSISETLTESSDTSTLILYPDLANQNGLAITVTDETGAVINNCTCCVYDIQYLAQQDSCSASIFQLTSNPFGKAAIFNIHPAVYYTHCQAKFGSFLLKGVDVSTVPTEGIVRKQVILHPQ